ncbi:hypothetical protein CN512_10655 [Bacillus cereus]|uniref:hypothetical protein n=1 Tax=Bacillus cereus TaxID=1396 RepID=UPI000BF6630B|nr:hypothetical protein [Bacillus cereus]PES69779.1 hypothetical protein CN512_10655 [Bacillus cereus]
MENFIMEQLASGGVVGLCIGGFAWLFRYVLKRNEIREEKLENTIERGVEREKEYVTVIRDNQDIMKQQAESIRDIGEIKHILQIKTKEREVDEAH